MNFDLIELDPTVEQLKEAVQATSLIVKESGMDLVHENRIALRDVRLKISKKGKELREEAIAYQKSVIEKERELIGIISPEEDRLNRLENELKLEETKKKRLDQLPSRKEKLLSIDGETVWATDDEILEKDDVAFGIFFNKCVESHNLKIKEALEAEVREKEEAIRKAQLEAEMEQRRLHKEAEEKLETDRKALEEEKAKVEAEKNRIAREQEIARLQKEAEEKAIKDLEEKKKREEEQAKIDAERIEKMKKDAEVKRLATEKYQNFLKTCGMTKENVSEFHKVETDTDIKIYKLVGTFTK